MSTDRLEAKRRFMRNRERILFWYNCMQAAPEDPGELQAYIERKLKELNEKLPSLGDPNEVN